MKLELEHTTPMRVVNYFGSNVYIPAHHIAISADPNGTLYSYDCVPKLDSDLWVHTTSGHDSVYAISGRVLFDDPQEWSSTLRIYPLFKVVEYFGWTISIPSHHNYIAADYSGRIYSYSKQPEIDLEHGVYLDIDYNSSSYKTRLEVESISFQFDNDEEWITTLKRV